MSLPSMSLKRPVAMGCLIIAFSLLGMNAYRKMGLELLPKVDVPYITIMTVYPGASPSEIETDIAKRIEDAVSSVDGLKRISSSCMEDACLMLLEFHMNVDVDVAANDVREKLETVQNDLPEDAERPQVLKFDVNALPIINLALTGDVSVEELYDYADNELRDRIAAISGVADIQLIGGAEREVQVRLKRDLLAARGLSSLDVVKAIGEGIRTIPSGRVREHETEYSVKFDGEYKDINQIGSLQLKSEDGSRCYLKDLGEIVMTTDELRQTAFLDSRPAISIRIVKKAEANAVQVVNEVKKAFETIKPLLPGGMELVWVSDDGDYIQSSVDSTMDNIWQGVLLTAAILLFFLINFRSTLIVAITMPLTMIIGLFFLQWMGYTLNFSTLMSLGLSVGILVTNSIVVLESIVSKLASTTDPKEAARLGAGEVGVAVAASAGTNMVVLFPISMMSSQVGMFFRPFAISMVIVTVISLFISFTLTPILCGLMLRRRTEKQMHGIQARIEKASNRFYDELAHKYTSFIRLFSRHRILALPVLIVVAIAFIHAIKILAPQVGFDFFGEADEGKIFIKLEYPTRYSLDQTVARTQEMEARIKDLPGLLHIQTNIGKVEGVMGQASEGVYLAQVNVQLCPKTERKETVHDLLGTIRERLNDFPDCISTVSVPSGVGGMSYPIEIVISGEDLDELNRVAERVFNLARNTKGSVDADTSVRMGKPEMRIRPKRAILADLDVPVTTMGTLLRANLAGIEAGIFKQGARSYDIRVKLEEEPGRDQVMDFMLPGAPGHPMVLTNFADIEDNLSPVQISRSAKSRVSKVFSQQVPGMALGNIVNELRAKIEKEGNLPAGYTFRFSGLYEVMDEANQDFAEAGLLAIILTYLVLAAMLESFKQPFIILITIPLGLIGVLWSLYLTHQTMSMFVILGSVMLIGIVVNNAILVMDRMNQLIAQGVARHEAMALAAGEELRPIIMITLAAVLGMIPLAVGQGIGSEMRNGIGIASIGGIGISAVLTLIVIPIMYILFTRHGKGSDGLPEAPTPETPVEADPRQQA